MSQFLIPFDPTSATMNQLITNLGQDAGVLLVLNDSAVNVKFTFADGSTRFSPAQSWRRIDLPPGNPSITWQQQSILSIAVPNSQVYAESFTSTEEIPEVFPAALVRGVVGNMTIASELVNVGNSAGTNIINASPTGAGGNISANNDGSRTVKLLDTGITTTYESLQNGSALASPVVAYGSPSNLAATTFNGVINTASATLGALVSAGGVATVGHWASVAHVSAMHITAIGFTNIIAITAPVNGMYRANLHFEIGNGTSGQFASTQLTYTSYPAGVTHNVRFITTNGGSLVVLSGATSIPNGGYACDALCFSAGVGTNIIIGYDDPANTPNDWIQADLELSVL